MSHADYPHGFSDKGPVRILPARSPSLPVTQLPSKRIMAASVALVRLVLLSYYTRSRRHLRRVRRVCVCAAVMG